MMPKKNKDEEVEVKPLYRQMNAKERKERCFFDPSCEYYIIVYVQDFRGLFGSPYKHTILQK